MSWVANPMTPLPYRAWMCPTCHAGNQAVMALQEMEGIRDEAVEHLTRTGHTVAVTRGTTETIRALATTPGGEGPDDAA